jgi:hypothetical protein
MVLAGGIHAPAHAPAHRDRVLVGSTESAAEGEDSDSFEDLGGLPCILPGSILDTATRNILVDFPFCTFGSRSLTLRAVPLRC